MFKLVIYLSLTLCAVQSFKLLAFNIQIFGQAKMKQPKVVEVLVDVISRYDMVLVQEIRDIKNTAFEELITAINKAVGTNKYQGKLSSRMGSTYSKEQYGIIYDPSVVTISDYREPVDPKKQFERIPVFMLLTFPKKAFAMIVGVIHVRPTRVPSEMDALYDHVLKIMTEWKIQDLIVAGDMNADCDFLSPEQLGNLKLRKDPSFRWLIADKTDTTVAFRTCTYDRIISHGRKIDSVVDPSSLGIFNFTDKCKLSHEQALKVSDHYPVQVELKI